MDYSYLNSYSLIDQASVVGQNPEAIKYITNPAQGVQYAAVRSNPYIILDIPNPDMGIIGYSLGLCPRLVKAYSRVGQTVNIDLRNALNSSVNKVRTLLRKFNTMLGGTTYAYEVLIWEENGYLYESISCDSFRISSRCKSFLDKDKEISAFTRNGNRLPQEIANNLVTEVSDYILTGIIGRSNVTLNKISLFITQDDIHIGKSSIALVSSPKEMNSFILVYSDEKVFGGVMK